MTAKELKRLRRSDLLEMLLTLRKENEELRQELEQAQQMLENQRITIENIESLADISQRLAETLETAKVVCERYSGNTWEPCLQTSGRTGEQCSEVDQHSVQRTRKRAQLKAMANNGVEQDRWLKKPSQKNYLPLKFWKRKSNG